jgi:mannose-6-phosphate isomerase-like protein (cupin superfamily)
MADTDSTDTGWDVFDMAELLSQKSSDPVSYKEFLRVPAMSCGVYRLAKGSNDMQTHHDEDELYYVVEGRARLRIGDKEREVSPGSVMYVRATEQHSFFEIEEDMVLLVIFPTGKT